jgi:hypothetical protein
MYRRRRPLGAERAQHLAEEALLRAKFKGTSKQEQLEQAATNLINEADNKKRKAESEFWSKIKDRRVNPYVKHLMLKTRRSFQNAIS